jgi:hypothetical protein
MLQDRPTSLHNRRQIRVAGAGWGKPRKRRGQGGHHRPRLSKRPHVRGKGRASDHYNCWKLDGQCTGRKIVPQKVAPPRL